ncbi:hypothetical protein OG21DRAFT_1598945 [Imleria badia]|nr:hypothetical protein OG21DRAFT_1598945 [Imleria badia]
MGFMVIVSRRREKTVHLKNWEDQGWTNVTNHEWFNAAAYHLRRRTAPTNFKWVKGHQGVLGNERADELANQGAQKTVPDHMDIAVPDNFKATGIRLSTLTQRLAYQTIQKKRGKNRPYPRQALINLDITRYAIQDITGHLETDATLWRNLRHPDIRRPIQAFLYRAMTGSQRIGEFWQRIPNCEHRANCTHCEGQIESLEHILFECDTPERQEIWNLTQKLWPDDDLTKFPKSLGHVLGCGSITTDPQDGNTTPSAKHQGTNRLKRILVSEAAHLIWTLRCDRVIGGNRHAPHTTVSHWKHKIQTRLDLDRQAAKSKRNVAFTNKITNTCWATHTEVLVGINLSRPPAVTGVTG